MVNFFTYFLERAAKRLNPSQKTSREGAAGLVRQLGEECILNDGKNSRSGVSCVGAAESILTSMNRWNQGYGEVFFSKGKTKDGKERIVIRHKIPGAPVCDSGGPGYDFPHTEYYWVSKLK